MLRGHEHPFFSLRLFCCFEGGGFGGEGLVTAGLGDEVEVAWGGGEGGADGIGVGVGGRGRGVRAVDGWIEAGR